MTQRRLPCKQHAGRLPARTNVSVPFGLHTFCVLSSTSYQVGVVTTCGFPERSTVNRCRERFWRVEVRVLRRSYLISRAAYLYPSHSPACLFTSCTRDVVPNQHVVLAVIQDLVPRTAAGGFFHLFKNLDLLPALRMRRKILSSRQLGLFFFFLSRLHLDEMLTQLRPFL